MGATAVDYNGRFRVFLVTRESHPLPADAIAAIAEVNFTATRSGPEGQLLWLALSEEKPELEQQKGALLCSATSTTRHCTM